MKKIEDLPLSEKAEWFVNVVFGGRHHCRTFEFRANHFFVIPNSNHSFATFDFDRLTRIVVMSHRLCLRAEVECHGMHGLRLLLHNRASRKGRMFERHPTMEESISGLPTLEAMEKQIQ